MIAEDTRYLTLVAIATILAAAAGLIWHFIRASFSRDLEATFAPNEMLALRLFMWPTHYFIHSVEKSVIGCEWDDNGFWDAYSLRNIAYLTLLGAAVPLLLGMIGWPQRHDVLARGCAAFVRFGLKPLFCS